MEDKYKCPLTDKRGLQGYKEGCRCDGCRNEKKLRNRLCRQNRRENHGTVFPSTEKYNAKKTANNKLSKLVPVCTCWKEMRRARLETEKANLSAIKSLAKNKLKDAERHKAKGTSLDSCLFPWNARSTAYQKGCRCKKCTEFISSSRWKWQKSRIDSDPDYRVHYLMRARFRTWFRRSGTSKTGSVGKLVGLSPTTLLDLLLSHPKSKPEFTRENYGSVWVIDHVKPLAWFDSSKPGDVRKAWHHSNLQPLSVKDNQRKSDSMIGDQHMLFNSRTDRHRKAGLVVSN